MKKVCTLLLLLCSLSVSACAQWYLFPGKKKQQQTETPADSMTAFRDSLLMRDAQTQQDSTVFADSLSAEAVVPDDVFVLDIPSVIHIGLVLPLQASEAKPNSNFLDLYSGALLALRDLGATGLQADLQVFDSADGKTAVPSSLIDESDVILGPVGYDEMHQALPQCTPGKVLISPLEPKTAPLAADHPMVQAPAPWTAQIDELVQWMGQEILPGAPVYVVRDTATVIQGEQSAYLIARLQDRMVNYKSVVSVREIPFEKNRPVNVLIASDRDNFITSTVKFLGIEGARNGNVTLYGTSRIRTNGTAQTDLHHLNAHLTSAYFIDYDDPAVEKFILAYRALFQNEPGSFAFQGYDAMHYFVSICARYGRQWYKKLPYYDERGLQSDFRFNEETPRVNQAVRRIVYHPDLTTSVAR